MWRALVVGMSLGLVGASSSLTLAQEMRLADYFWLTRPGVQADLGMTEGQREQLTALIQRERQERKALETVPREKQASRLDAIQDSCRRQFDAILQPEQRRRLSQIAQQMRGPGAVSSTLGTQLRLTADQRRRLESLSREHWRRAAEPRDDLRDSRQADVARRRAIDLRLEYLQKALEVLSPEQMRQWRERTGSPVRF